jgi:hypothetical protein
MRIVKLQNEDVNVKDCWMDLTTAEYISLMELYAESADMVSELFLVKFITILTGKDQDFISSLYEEELLEFPDIISSFKTDDFLEVEQKSFILGGQLYSYVIPNKLTLGEKISIKLLEKNSKSQYEQWLNLLTVLIKPAKEKTNEFGEVEYIIDQFDGNIDTLNKRKELLKEIPGINSMYIIKAFTDGRLKSQ